MKKIALAVALTAAASTAMAGSMGKDDVVMEPVVVVEEVAQGSSAAGVVVPLMLVLLFLYVLMWEGKKIKMLPGLYGLVCLMPYLAFRCLAASQARERLPSAFFRPALSTIFLASPLIVISPPRATL